MNGERIGKVTVKDKGTTIVIDLSETSPSKDMNREPLVIGLNLCGYYVFRDIILTMLRRKLVKLPREMENESTITREINV